MKHNRIKSNYFWWMTCAFYGTSKVAEMRFFILCVGLQIGSNPMAYLQQLKAPTESHGICGTVLENYSPLHIGFDK